jgi:hypothetical protein
MGFGLVFKDWILQTAIAGYSCVVFHWLGIVASRLGAADGIAISSRAIFRPSRSKSARVIRKEKLTSVVEKFSCPIFADGINAVGRTIS